MRHRIASLIVSVFMCSPAIAAPLKISIAQLLHQPDRYAMKVVELTGQIDDCHRAECNICPLEMTPETLDLRKCLALNFTGYARKGAVDDRAVAFTALEQVPIFRFASVTLEARFDPACLTGKVYNEDGSVHVNRPGSIDTFAICSDTAVVLKDARVTDVLSRKDTSNGLISWSGGMLTEADAAMTAEIAAIWAGDTKTLDPERFKVFLPSADGRPKDAGVDRDALLCVCNFSDCSGKWPTRIVLGFDSPASPFYCDSVSRRNGVWRIRRP